MKLSMINLIIYFILLIAFFLILGNLEIKFNPFSIKIPDWWKPTGIILITIGVIFLVVGYGSKRYMDGFKKGSEEVMQIIQK